MTKKGKGPGRAGSAGAPQILSRTADKEVDSKMLCDRLVVSGVDQGDKSHAEMKSRVVQVPVA